MTYVREHRVHCGILECINGIHCRHFNVCVSVNQVSLINRWLSRVCASYVVTIEICEMIKKFAAFIVNGIFPVLVRFAEIKRLPPPLKKRGKIKFKKIKEIQVKLIVYCGDQLLCKLNAFHSSNTQCTFGTFNWAHVGTSQKTFYS